MRCYRRRITFAFCAEEFKRELTSRPCELAATLQVRQGAKGPRGSRVQAALLSRVSCGRNDGDDRAVPCGAWVAVVAREQMFQEFIDLTVLVAAEFYVFLERKVAGAPRFFRSVKSVNCFEPDTVKLFTRMVCWHGRRNNTTTEM
jgi:hypothetical protein